MAKCLYFRQSMSSTGSAEQEGENQTSSFSTSKGPESNNVVGYQSQQPQNNVTMQNAPMWSTTNLNPSLLPEQTISDAFLEDPDLLLVRGTFM